MLFSPQKINVNFWLRLNSTQFISQLGFERAPMTWMCLAGQDQANPLAWNYWKKFTPWIFPGKLFRVKHMGLERWIQRNHPLFHKHYYCFLSQIFTGCKSSQHDVLLQVVLKKKFQALPVCCFLAILTQKRIINNTVNNHNRYPDSCYAKINMIDWIVICTLWEKYCKYCSKEKRKRYVQRHCSVLKGKKKINKNATTW